MSEPSGIKSELPNSAESSVAYQEPKVSEFFLKSTATSHNLPFIQRTNFASEYQSENVNL